MKIEVAPWIKDYVTGMDDLYSELSLEKLNEKACGPDREKLTSYQELFPVQEPESAECQQKKLPGKHRKRGRKILFKAEPGMGKTTLVKKVAWDWAKGVFTAVSIVFFVFLKLVNPGDAIENVIVDQTPVLEGLDITGSKIKTILETFGPRCLLILDGLDEHALGQNEDVVKIMKGQKYLFCNVIVTSRPHSTKEYEKYFPSVVSVEGFTKNEARKFASRIVQDCNKVEDILNFNPYNRDTHFSLHNVPILLSFLCVLVREDQIDLTSREMQIGEIYFRMVRCLYRKFTLRKGIEYQDSKFVEMLQSLSKLALKGQTLLKRSDVLEEVGPDAFDYGLLIGHEDFRLIRDETADILVSFPHRTILEFFWSFCFIFLLNEGKSVEHLLGIYDILSDVLLTNPLFLNFSLWFLATRETTFSFLAQVKIRHILVRYIAGKIDSECLNLQDIGDKYSALHPEVAQRDENNILLLFLKDVLAQCRQTEYLVVGIEHPVDWVLSAMNVQFKSIKELTIQPEPVNQLWDKELERESASVNVWKPCPEMDLNVLFRSFGDIDELKTVMKHCMIAKRKPCVHLGFHGNTFELSEILQKEMIGLHLGCGTGALAYKKNLSVCPSLRHLSIMGFKVSEALLSVLSTAIQNSTLPNLSCLSFSYSRFETDGFLSVLFQSKCSSVQYLESVRLRVECKRSRVPGDCGFSSRKVGSPKPVLVG